MRDRLQQSCKALARGKSRLAGHLLEQGARVPIEVRGGSMSPLIREGDQVLIEKIPAAELKPGDVVLFETGNGWVLHRFLCRSLPKEAGVWFAKGDSVVRRRQRVNESSVLGRAVRVEGSRGRRELGAWRWKLYAVLCSRLVLLNDAARAMWRLLRRAGLFGAPRSAPNAGRLESEGTSWPTLRNVP